MRAARPRASDHHPTLFYFGARLSAAAFPLSPPPSLWKTDPARPDVPARLTAPECAAMAMSKLPHARPPNSRAPEAQPIHKPHRRFAPHQRAEPRGSCAQSAPRAPCASHRPLTSFVMGAEATAPRARPLGLRPSLFGHRAHLPMQKRWKVTSRFKQLTGRHQTTVFATPRKQNGYAFITFTFS